MTDQTESDLIARLRLERENQQLREREQMLLAALAAAERDAHRWRSAIRYGREPNYGVAQITR